MKNLWPTIDTSNKENPSSLMAQQGDYLEKLSKGVLTYDIKRHAFKHENWNSGQGLRFEFYIQATAMDNFKFLLFWVAHDLILSYPCRISNYKGKVVMVNNRTEFIEQLEIILSSDSTKSVLESLISQST